LIRGDFGQLSTGAATWASSFETPAFGGFLRMRIE